jgi:hypothetical protein
MNGVGVEIDENVIALLQDLSHPVAEASGLGWLPGGFGWRRQCGSWRRIPKLTLFRFILGVVSRRNNDQSFSNAKIAKSAENRD